MLLSLSHMHAHTSGVPRKTRRCLRCSLAVAWHATTALRLQGRMQRCWNDRRDRMVADMSALQQMPGSPRPPPYLQLGTV